MQPGQTLAMYTQLMAINALAFAEGQYEVAYHALVAAFHCAHDLQDSDRVVAVQQQAAEQRHGIDELAPGHYHTGRPPEWRQRVSNYGELARQAQMVALLLDRQRRTAALQEVLDERPLDD